MSHQSNSATESKITSVNGAYANPAFISTIEDVKYGVDKDQESLASEFGKPYWSQSLACRFVCCVILLGMTAGFIAMFVCMGGHCGRWEDVETGGKCANLEIVSRAEWGAREPANPPTTITTTNMTFLHHTAGRECSDKETCMEYTRLIQDFHMDDRGWDDIGYNFLVGEDGRVYEGRGWLVQGAHAPTYNAISHGIAIFGTFMDKVPAKYATDTAKKLMDCGIQLGKVKRDHELFGHRDGRCTDCPGDALYASLRNWPHYSYRQIPVYCESP